MRTSLVLREPWSYSFSNDVSAPTKRTAFGFNQNSHNTPMSKPLTRPTTLEELTRPHTEVEALTEKYELSDADQLLLAALARCCASETSPLFARQPDGEVEWTRRTLVAALSERDERLSENFVAAVSRRQSGGDGSSTGSEELHRHFETIVQTCEKLHQQLKWAVAFSLGAVLCSILTFLSVAITRQPESQRWSNIEVGLSAALEKSGDLRLVAGDAEYWLKRDSNIFSAVDRRMFTRPDSAQVSRVHARFEQIWSGLIRRPFRSGT